MKNSREYAEKIVEEAIFDTIEIFQKYPFYFGNEESIRNMLFSKIIPHYIEPRYYKKKESKESSYLSSALHANPYLQPDGLKPDLLLYYIKNNAKTPILLAPGATRKFWPFQNNPDANCSINQRIIIEIKFNKNFRTLSPDKKTKLIDDINKTSRWDSLSNYVIHFDRSNSLNNKLQNYLTETILKNLKAGNDNLSLIYGGYSRLPNINGKRLHIKNGEIMNF